MSKLIPLSQSHFAVVDDEDYEWINQWKWSYNDGYARRMYRQSGKQIVVRMHRLINETPIGFDTDHINQNKLDNRRCNLRTCNRPVNQLNRMKLSNNTTGFAGVTFHKTNKKFQAQLKRKSSKSRHLGYFTDPIEAFRVYSEAKREAIMEELCSVYLTR